MPPREVWVTAGLVFVAGALATVVLAGTVEWLIRRQNQRKVAAQLERLNTEALDSMAPGAGALLRGNAAEEAPWVARLTGWVPHLRDVQSMLSQGGMRWSVRSYLTYAGGSALAVAAAVFVLSKGVLLPVIGALFGAAMPYIYVSRRRARRLARFEEYFPAAVDLLGRALRAGHPLSAALKIVADEVEEPVAGEFRAVFEEQRFGLPFADSLHALADRVPLADVRIFVTAVLIQREVGGNLTEILTNLAEVIRQRFTLHRQVKVLTAEGRYSVYVLTAMPLGIAAFVSLTNLEYLRPLYQTPIGRTMLASALVMQVLGYVWMRRITTIEY